MHIVPCTWKATEIAEHVIHSIFLRKTTNEHISEKTIALDEIQYDLAIAASNSFVEKFTKTRGAERENEASVKWSISAISKRQ